MQFLFQNSTGEPVYRKVAVVENFFDIIYNVHVDLEGRPGKHAGQKRTYRTITETYAFLPREAVTRFLLGCTECQKHPRSPSPPPVLPTPSPSPTLPPATALQQTGTANSQAAPLAPAMGAACQVRQDGGYYGGKNGAIDRTCLSPPVDQPLCHPDHPPTPPRKEGPLKTSTPDSTPKRSSNPLDVCNLTSRDPPKIPAKKRHYESAPKLWSPVETIESDEPQKKRVMLGGDIDYSLPITTTYLKYMRSLGCRDEDAFKFDNKHNPVNNDTNVPLHQVLSQESSDEVQGDMVEEGESQHTERYEDHSSSENLFDSDREERRYPLRERKPKDFSNFKLYHTKSGIEDDPVTVEDAMSRYDRKMWKNAMKDEYNSLIENKVWELVDLPGKKLVQNISR
ncbi:hypothetical protein JTB14_009061 [Gonioctena quinquepunctata]|nr:hypothetical protein JTB14_009061 [Gonioctena quinquepunctata]